RDEVRAEIRHLDADRLLAGDRREDADLRRRESVAQVVFQVRDLADLRARRELQLVARHARARDLPDDRRLDAEVRKTGDERLGDALVRLAVRAGARLRLLEQGAVRQLVLGERLERFQREELFLGVLGRV